MKGYPSDRLSEEVAYLAHTFHWTYDEIMKMDHRERQSWVAAAARLHQRLREEGES